MYRLEVVPLSGRHTACFFAELIDCPVLAFVARFLLMQHHGEELLMRWPALRQALNHVLADRHQVRLLDLHISLGEWDLPTALWAFTLALEQVMTVVALVVLGVAGLARLLLFAPVLDGCLAFIEAPEK